MPRYIDIEEIGEQCFAVFVWQTGDCFAVRADTISEPMQVQGSADPDDVMEIIW
jgi:hypothetical protein